MKEQSDTQIKLKRAYERPLESDGVRILVERLWPRGVKREAIKIDYWFKEIAPSSCLRKWFAHDPERWYEFRRAYRCELVANDTGQLADLITLAMSQNVSLIFAARDTEHNSAVVLRDFVIEGIAKRLKLLSEIRR